MQVVSANSDALLNAYVKLRIEFIALVECGANGGAHSTLNAVATAMDCLEFCCYAHWGSVINFRNEAIALQHEQERECCDAIIS